jgi:hypothetical protein
MGDLSIKRFPEIKESEKLFKVVKNTKRLIEKEIKLLNGVASGNHIQTSRMSKIIEKK